VLEKTAGFARCDERMTTMREVIVNLYTTTDDTIYFAKSTKGNYFPLVNPEAMTIDGEDALRRFPLMANQLADAKVELANYLMEKVDNA